MKLIRYFLILGVIAAIAYGNALKSPFMLDDYPFFSQFQGRSIVSHFIPNQEKQLGKESSKTQHTYYRPLAHVIPHISYLFFKNNPFPYHVFNLMLLILAAFSVVLLLQQVMLPYHALIVGILFLIHPINGIMVNYITASVFAVQVIFLCLSLIATMGVGRLRHAFACVYFVLALLCHETSVMIPFYAILLFLVEELNIKRAIGRTKWLWAILGGYIILRHFYVPLSKSLFYSISISGLSWDQAMASLFPLLAWYVKKLFIPVDIFLMWSRPFVRQAGWDYITMGLIVIGVIGFIARVLWRLDRRLVLFFLWFVIGLLPIFLGAFATPYLGSLLEPHWFIPATIGFCAAVVMSLNYFIPNKFWQRILFMVIAGILLVCAWGNNRLWGNEINFYERWLQEAPDFKAAHYFLGTVYTRQGEYDQAREHFGQSLAGRYKDWMVYLNLAQVDIKQGRVDQAKINIQKAYDLEAHNSDIMNTMGVLELEGGELDKAKEYFYSAIEMNRFNIEPHINLAIMYKHRRENLKAINEYEQVLRIVPDYAPAKEALERLK